MRLVYLDESGIAQRQQEPVLVVAGVIVEADSQVKAVEQHLLSLIEKHIPDQARGGFSFHAADIFGGSKFYKRTEWPLDRRLAIADDLASIPRTYDLPIVYAVLRKEKFDGMLDKEALQHLPKINMSVLQHASAFVTCGMKIETWMRANAENERCMLVVENNEEAKSFISSLQADYQNPKVIDILDDDVARSCFPYEKIMHTPLFENKSSNTILQVADFCAFVLKRKAMQDQDYGAFFSTLEPCFVNNYPDNKK